MLRPKQAICDRCYFGKHDRCIGKEFGAYCSCDCQEENKMGTSNRMDVVELIFERHVEEMDDHYLLVASMLANMATNRASCLPTLFEGPLLDLKTRNQAIQNEMKRRSVRKYEQELAKLLDKRAKILGGQAELATVSARIAQLEERIREAGG